MKLLPDRLSRIVVRDFVEREIEDELQFHLSLRAQEHVASGMSDVDAHKLAAQQFGNLQQIKTECAQIANRNRLLVRLTKPLLVVILIAGIFIHAAGTERDVRHIGDILIAIAILMRLLLYVRGLSRFKFSNAGRK